MRPRMLCVSAVVASVGLSASAAPLPYRFDKVAETGATFTNFGLPALNDNAVAAFVGDRANGSDVYFGNQFLVQQVPAVPGALSTQTVDINNAGQVTFARTAAPPPGQTRGDQVIYRADPSGIVTIGRGAGILEDQVTGGPTVNNTGVVGYSTSATIRSQTLKGDGTGDPQVVFSSAGNIGGAAINNAGNVAFVSSSPFGSFLQYNDRTVAAASNTSPSTTFTDPDTGATGPFTAVRGFDIGDSDRVVFSARWNNLLDAFYVWDDGVITKVAGTNGLTGTPAINDLGVVAGLVTGNGPTRLAIFEAGVEGTIISVGSPLDGSTVTGLNFSPEGFNNLNQVAFLATLADGRTVNVIASIPEPGAVAMLIVAGAGMLVRRQRLH